MEAIGLLGLLGICGYEDIKAKKIRIVVVNIFAIFGVVMHLLFQRLSVWNMIGGAFIGAALILLAYLSKEKIGYGDGFLFVATGIYLGFWNNLALLMLSTGLLSLYAGIRLLIGKLKKEGTQIQELPLIPFVLIVYIIALIIRGGSIL